MTESELQSATADYLRAIPPAAYARPFIAFHPPMEDFGRRSGNNRRVAARQGEVAGVADWCLCWEGGAAFVELKTASGSLSAAQRAFRARCHLSGVPYRIARSLDDFEGALLSFGLVLYPLLRRRAGGVAASPCRP